MAKLLVFKARNVLADNPTKASFEEIECAELKDYYAALECDCFDIVARKIGGKYFDIFCDDEGLFKLNPVSLINEKTFEPMLVGNLIFANHDAEGETISLTDDDIKLVKASIIPVNINGIDTYCVTSCTK